MQAYHVAQYNIARLIAPLDDPRIAGFVAALDPINRLGDASPGFPCSRGFLASERLVPPDRGRQLDLGARTRRPADLDQLQRPAVDRGDVRVYVPQRAC